MPICQPRRAALTHNTDRTPAHKHAGGTAPLDPDSGSLRHGICNVMDGYIARYQTLASRCSVCGRPCCGSFTLVHISPERWSPTTTSWGCSVSYSTAVVRAAARDLKTSRVPMDAPKRARLNQSHLAYLTDQARPAMNSSNTTCPSLPLGGMPLRGRSAVYFGRTDGTQSVPAGERVANGRDIPDPCTLCLVCSRPGEIMPQSRELQSEELVGLEKVTRDAFLLLPTKMRLLPAAGLSWGT
ncbi:hypothetical protein AAFF_G00003390 [Aldrovandia affinis]|uniref:Uncharacterized protein n=1 Tax=Aldrovandia affinis TaxID=143900 RepID=A0AAD7TDH0_9TELE|nr:hypothetical protein AAFF_G00003390 [Aldrovandia affinis]